MSKKWTKWIPHTGDECPVDGDEVVRVKFADGLVCKYQIANTWEWEAFNDDGRITHYKRLKANVEAEMERDQNESARHDPDARPSKLSTKFDKPTPIITGPGEYKARDGRKATVYNELTNREYDFNGNIDGRSAYWFSNGRLFSNKENAADIIGPWEEPAPETITPSDVDTLLTEIDHELKFARSKFPGKNVTFAALVEEVGELAKATFEEPRANVRKEAVQVAVMAIRMVLDGDHTFDGWREIKGLDALTISRTMEEE